MVIGLALAIILLGFLAATIYITNERNYSFRQLAYESQQAAALIHQSLYLRLNQTNLGPRLYVTDTSTQPIQLAYLLETSPTQSNQGSPGGSGGGQTPQNQVVPASDPANAPAGVDVQGAGALPYQVDGNGVVGYAYGTPGYQGQNYGGMTVQPFPAGFTADNNGAVACTNPATNSEGYTASATITFNTATPTFETWTDDASAVFLINGNITSVFGSNAWHGQGATPYYATAKVQPGVPYTVAVQWENICAPGMSALKISGVSQATEFTGESWMQTSGPNPMDYSSFAPTPAFYEYLQPGQTVNAYVDSGYTQFVVVTTLGLAVTIGGCTGNACATIIYAQGGDAGTTPWGQQTQPFPFSFCPNGQTGGAVGFTAVTEATWKTSTAKIESVFDDGGQVFIRKLGPGDTAGQWQTVYNQQAWHSPAPTTYTATVTVTPNTPYEVVLDYYMNNCNAPAAESALYMPGAQTQPYVITIWQKTSNSPPSNSDYTAVTEYPDDPVQWGWVEITGNYVT